MIDLKKLNFDLMRENALNAVPIDCMNHILLLDYVKYAQTRIEGLEAQLPKWVSVDEPPKTYGWYLICISDPLNLGYDTSRAFKAWFNEVCQQWTDADCIEDGCEVTHWMPLPQPRKGKDND